MKHSRLIAAIIAAATAIAPFSLNIPTGTVFAGSSTLDAESFFVYVGTYGGSSSQFRYLYHLMEAIMPTRLYGKALQLTFPMAIFSPPVAKHQ